MPEEPRTSAIRRLLEWRPRARLHVVLALVAVAVLGAVSVIATTGASNVAPDDASRASAPALTASPNDVSALGSFGLLPPPWPGPGLRPSKADAAQLEAFGRWMKIASQPTATASPPPQVPSVVPTATAAPPTATPRPVYRAPAPTQPAAGSGLDRATPPPPPQVPWVAPTSTPAPPPPPPPAPAASGLDTSPMDAPSQQLFDMTNRRRISQGLPPLRANGQLVGIARIRSKDMADHNYFAHVSPVTGDNAFTLMDKHGVPYGWAGENLAKNNYPAGQAVGVAEDALWNSAPHRENILNAHYTDMGIALAVDASGMNYFTIIFTGPA